MSNEALDVLIEDSETGSSDSEEVFRYIVKDGTTEEEALFDVQAGLEQQVKVRAW